MSNHVSDILVPVLRGQEIRAWPKHEEGGHAAYLSPALALTQQFPFDCHTAQYTVPNMERRLDKGALERSDALTALGGFIAMIWIIFDIDCAASHKALGGSGEMPAPDDWWLGELVKINELRAAHPDVFIYRTRGGWRLIAMLPTPYILLSPADAEAWTKTYLTSVAYLRRRFGIIADPGCKDWGRLFRLPHATRFEKARRGETEEERLAREARNAAARPEQRETIGDPHKIGVWAPMTTAEDAAAAEALDKRKPPKPTPTRKPKAPVDMTSSAANGVLFQAFTARHSIGSQLEPGKWTIRCPREHEHSRGEAFDGSTVLYAPSEGSEMGWIHCSHSNSGHDRLTIRDWLGGFLADELVHARAAAGLPPSPPYQAVRSPEAPASAPPGAGAPPSSGDDPRDHGATRPEIVVTTDEHLVVDQAIAALASYPNLFQRGGALVHVVRDVSRQATDKKVLRPSDAPRIREIPQAHLRELMAQTARWVKWGERQGVREKVPCHPPDWAVQEVSARGSWPGIRKLVNITESPTLRPDGTVLQQPGYDEATGMLYEPSCSYPTIPEAPTQADAIRARDELLEVVSDFPFAGPAHQSAWLALLLTMVARSAIEGPVPMAGIDATTRGTGKGKLADATTVIATGHVGAKMSLPGNDDEFRKRISSIVLEGDPVAMLDNVNQPIESPSLDAAITSIIWKDRALGRLGTITGPHRAVWIGTGNNLQFGGDTGRRVLHIRLESPLENPEERTDFKHADLLAWALEERPRLVCAALTLLRAYVAAGRPDQKIGTLGSFEQWARLIPHALVWAGMPDPKRTRKELESVADTTKAALDALIDGWQKMDITHAGLTAKEVITRLYTSTWPPPASPEPPYYASLRSAIETLVPPAPGGQPNSLKLGRKLSSVRRRVIGDRMFDATLVQGIQRWRVVGAQAEDKPSSSAKAIDAANPEAPPAPTAPKRDTRAERKTFEKLVDETIDQQFQGLSDTNA